MEKRDMNGNCIACQEKPSAPRVVVVGLASCFGCQLQITNAEAHLLDVLGQIDLRYWQLASSDPMPEDFDLYLTVDHPDDTWDGEVGLVTKPFEHLEIDAANTFGALCGPPVMYRFAIDEMRKKGISYDHIYVSFERHMKCGMGKCGHCQIGHQYVCIDGPVFNYWEAKNIQGSM